MSSSCDMNVDPRSPSPAEDSYIIMDIPVHSPFTLDTPYTERTPPLTEEQFLLMFDSDGRLVKERELRKAVFLGGIEPTLRKSVWPFLFGMYPCQSTKREREVLMLEYVIKYHEMKVHCLHVLNKMEEAAAAKANTGVSDENVTVDEFTHEDNSPHLNLAKSPSSGDDTSWITVNMDSSAHSNAKVRPIIKHTSQSSLCEDIFTDTSSFYRTCTVCGEPLDLVEKNSSPTSGRGSASEGSQEHLCTCFHSLSPEEISPSKVAQLPLLGAGSNPWSLPLQSHMVPVADRPGLTGGSGGRHGHHPRNICDSMMEYSLMVNQSGGGPATLPLSPPSVSGGITPTATSSATTTTTRERQSSTRSSESELEDIATAVAEAEAKKFRSNVFSSDLISSGLSLDWNSPDVQKQIDFIDFQAQIYAKKQKVHRRKFWGDMRIIKRDVPRTDRNHELFREDDSKYLNWLRNMLTTYTYFHRDVGYTQGMNDIAASFLSTFQNEPLAYWCFQSYMESVKEEFKEDGMVRKMDKVQQLVNEVDTEVKNHLTKYQLSMVCCQRWLVVGFKREFDLEDSLKCFEIINSRHLELTAVETELIRRKHCKLEVDDFGGTLRMVSSMDKPPYSFDIFMCAALLLELREEIFNWTSLEDIYVGMNSIKINLNDAVKKGEQLFHHYCKKMVDDCFLEVNPGLSAKAL
ncbi:small G protein signaling modulator 2-like [Argonauta hians]